jgi:ABC-type amino acid transport substrate-binding protein
MPRLVGLLAVFLLVLNLGSVARAAVPLEVRVGVYESGISYFYQGEKQAGFTPDLVAALNEIQEAYRFVIRETSARRRFQDLRSGRLDVIMLESPSWDWESEAVLFSKPIVIESYLYVSRRDRVPGADWFFDVGAHSLAAVLGFNYGFAQMDDDPETLHRNFNIALLYNEEEVLESILRGDSEIGVISAGYLSRRFSDKPALSEEIIIGPKRDSAFGLGAVISHSATIDLEAFEGLIDLLRRSGMIERQWQHWHRAMPEY